MKRSRRHPLERAISLLEYVVETDGAHHLKSQARNLNLMQYYSIDCILVLVAMFAVGNFAFLYLCFKGIGRLGQTTPSDGAKTNKAIKVKKQ